MRNTLICTVGTSLFGNLKNAEDSIIRRTHPNGIVEFVLTWTDRGLGLCIQTTGRNQAETNTIALHLAEEFSE